MNLVERIKEKLAGHITPRGFDELIGAELKEVAKLEADNERYLEALRSIAGTNTKPSHLKKNWKEMMLVAKQRAKEALGGEQ